MTAQASRRAIVRALGGAALAASVLGMELLVSLKMQTPDAVHRTSLAWSSA